MKSKYIPPSSVAVWFVLQGTYPSRVELYCSPSKTQADDWLNDYQGPTLRLRNKAYVTKAHIIWLGNRWYRIYANPVQCAVPVGLKPDSAKAPALLGLPKPEVHPEVKHPGTLSWIERWNVLITGKL